MAEKRKNHEKVHCCCRLDSDEGQEVDLRNEPELIQRPRGSSLASDLNPYEDSWKEIG